MLLKVKLVMSRYYRCDGEFTKALLSYLLFPDTEKVTRLTNTMLLLTKNRLDWIYMYLMFSLNTAHLTFPDRK